MFCNKLTPHFVADFLRVIFLGIVCSSSAFAQEYRGYKSFIDLKNIRQDRARVTVHPPPLSQDTVVVVFPRAIPGTYDEQRYAEYVVNFTAVDSNGQSMPWTRTSDGQFEIPKARSIYFLTFEVDDTFDNTDSTRARGFGPEGTSIQVDTIMQLNHGGFLPYVDGMQDYPYGVIITKPKRLFGASSLDIARVNDTTDSYTVRSYDELIDHPVLYAVADTASFTIGTTTVLVACAHRSKHTFAKKLAPILQQACETIGRFLPAMPVQRYAFLFYLWDGKPIHTTWNGRGFGALEHGTSSLYYLIEQLAEQDLDEIAIHEFLHILVPLNLHSEEIATFNFRTPRMSRHLWLYEGVTEYHSMLARVRDSSISEQAFVRELQQKLAAPLALPSGMSFTEFSRRILEPGVRDAYPLVYTYGAINAAVLDIELRRHTKRQMGLLELIMDLTKDYGRNKPFADTALFTEIERRTTPEFGTFLRKHVDGTTPLPLAEVFERVGLAYEREALVEATSYGIELDLPQSMERSAVIIKAEDDNELGARSGDEVVAINGAPMDLNSPSFSTLFRPSIGTSVTLTVKRDGETMTLQGKARVRKVRKRHVLRFMENPTSEQRALRDAWLYGAR
jgi:predicted metalloprotease with PDZ domain